MRTIKNRFKKGFTLYEVVVTLAIVLIIMGIVLFNQSKFRSDIEITNLAYRVALAVREAQVYSISVKQFAGSQSSQRFDVPYGLHFNKEVDDAFILFADADRDGRYTNTGPGQPGEENPDMN